jgi:hypothetical protein
MKDLITLSCPSCGASLKVAPGTKQVSCEYCGNIHVLFDSSIKGSFSFPSGEITEAQEKLMKFFDFDLMDLHYNRNGKLSSYQERRFFVEGFTAFMLCLAGGLIITLVIMLRSPFKDLCVCSSVSLIASLIPGIIIGNLLIKPVEVGVIESTIGTLGKSSKHSWRPAFCIGDETFHAKEDPFTILEWDVPYKIYYTPVRRTVLSIEISSLSQTESSEIGRKDQVP